MPIRQERCREVPPLSFPLNRACSCLALCLAASLFSVAPASASHLKGGSVSASIGAEQHLTGHVELIYRSTSACPTTPSQLAFGGVQVSGPAGFSSFAMLTNVVMVTCLPSSKTESGDFDVDLSAAPDGTYTITYTNCCRVTPIANVGGGASASTEYSATIQKAGSTVASTPSLTSNVALGISTHAAYDQNLNATGSLPLGYLLLQSTTLAQPDYDASAPSTNIVLLNGTGNVSIPAGTTSGLVPNAAYVYKVRVVDVFGNSAEREVLLTVSNNNVPVLAGPQSAVDVPAGATTTLQFSATDVDSSQNVTILPAGLPAWASVNPTAGNPATATITLTPPAGTTPQDVTVNIDATDDDSIAPMTDSRSLTLHVVAPAAPAPIVPPAPFEPTPVLVSPPPPVLAPPPPPAPKPAKKPAVKPASAVLLAPEAIVVAGGRSSVQCRVSGNALTSCTVKAYAQITGPDGEKTLVLVGSGHVGAVPAGGSARVQLTLNSRGNRLVSRIGGVKVVLKLTGRSATGQTVRARGQALLLPPRVRMVTAPGLFDSGSAEMTDAERAAVDRLAGLLGRVKSIVCTGNTDGLGSDRYNAQLALARAEAVCAVLSAGSPGIAVTARSAGESVPAASNDTYEGRAQNRRVDVLLTY
jgi:outer membrane protein OmpA-like peptidoglycan-associated protein